MTRTVSPKYPEPGRLVSLGPKADRLDAEAMIAVLRAAAGVRERHGVSSANHMVREALWECWERPRLPGPLVASKYPTAWPWSPDARRVYEQAGGQRPKIGGWGLVFEHLAPRGLVVTSLIDASAKLTPARFIQQLKLEIRGAVVTQHDARMLDEAKVGKGHPDGADPVAQPWCRYEYAGLDPASFRPLSV